MVESEDLAVMVAMAVWAESGDLAVWVAPVVAEWKSSREAA